MHVLAQPAGEPAELAACDLLIDVRHTATQALKQVGEGIKGQLQQSIINTNDPPLAPATIAAKSKGGTSAAKLGVDGPAKPLIDTGTMIKSVDWEITG